MTALTLVGGLLLILIGSELFTNAVEWLGHLLRLGSGATGSLLAALGTALPETVVVVVALVSSGPGSTQVATGAVLGSSFLLVTLGAAATGAAALTRSGARTLRIDPGHARRDLGVFLVAFAVAVGSTVLARPQRVVVGVLLLLLYAAYARATLRGGGEAGEAPEPLHLARWRTGPPPPAAVGLQLLLSVGLLVVASILFVGAVEEGARSLGADPLVLAVLVVPLATELPETLNSVLWTLGRRDSLAFGNVAGATVFQACVLGFIGVAFTPWQLGTAGLASAACAFVTGVYLLGLLRRGRAHAGWLLIAALPWAGYAVAELAVR